MFLIKKTLSSIMLQRTVVQSFLKLVQVFDLFLHTARHIVLFTINR